MDATAQAELEADALPAASQTAQPGAADAAKVIDEWRRFFGTSADTVTETPAQFRQALRAYFEKSTSATDLSAYLQTVALEARMRPVQGLMRALTYLPYALARYPGTLWRLFATSVQDPASGWKTKLLPAPGENLKYLIFSDLHRDCRADDRGPFTIGSIDHFTANARLYCRVLDYAALALGAFERFPRNWPVEGRPIDTLTPRAKLFDAPSPALHAVLTTLWMFPPAGSKVDIGGDELSSRVELLGTGTSLRLTVTVKKRDTSPVVPANQPVA